MLIQLFLLALSRSYQYTRQFSSSFFQSLAILPFQNELPGESEFAFSFWKNSHFSFKLIRLEGYSMIWHDTQKSISKLNYTKFRDEIFWFRFYMRIYRLELGKVQNIVHVENEYVRLNKWVQIEFRTKKKLTHNHWSARKN